LKQKSLKPRFLGFKVIDVDTTKKHVTSACYKKTGCLCLSATIFTLDKPIAEK